MKWPYQLWKTVEEWEARWHNHNGRLLVLLKHSTACPISAAALQEFVIFCGKFRRKVDVAVLYVIESRALSNQVEADCGVTHESPQVLVIVDGKVLWHASHWQITYERMEQATLKGMKELTFQR
jgi:bacillithiol system protein YtxJ